MRVSEVARLDSLLNGRDRGGWAGEAASTGPSVVSFAGLGGHYSRQDETRVESSCCPTINQKETPSRVSPGRGVVRGGGIRPVVS